MPLLQTRIVHNVWTGSRWGHPGHEPFHSLLINLGRKAHSDKWEGLHVCKREQNKRRSRDQNLFPVHLVSTTCDTFDEVDVSLFVLAAHSGMNNPSFFFLDFQTSGTPFLKEGTVGVSQFTWSCKHVESDRSPRPCFLWCNATIYFGSTGWWRSWGLTLIYNTLTFCAYLALVPVTRASCCGDVLQDGLKETWKTKICFSQRLRIRRLLQTPPPSASSAV